jgi:hypothetical protein
MTYARVQSACCLAIFIVTASGSIALTDPAAAKDKSPKMTVKFPPEYSRHNATSAASIKSQSKKKQLPGQYKPANIILKRGKNSD